MVIYADNLVRSDISARTRGKPTRFVVLLALLPALALGVCAYGSDIADGAPRSEELFDLSLEQLMEVDVDTVSTASKYQQKISEAPSSVTVVTADEIRKYGYRTLAEALRSIPGFYINYDRFYHYVGVRGYRRSGTYDTGILLLVDGHRTNENIGDSPAFGTHFLLDIDLIDRIEIIRGPGAALYGSNALFAVINVVTKTGQDIAGLELSGEIASFDTMKGRVTYGNKLENGPEFLVSATRYNSEGPNLYFSEFDDPENNNGWVQNDDDAFDNLVANVQWGDVKFMIAHATRDKRIPTAPWSSVFGDARTESWEENTLVGLTYAKDLSATWALKGRLAYAHHYYYGDWPSDYAEEGEDPNVVVNKERYRGNWWEGEVQIVGEPVAGHKLTAGTEFRYNQRQEQMNWDEEVYLDDSRHGHNWGLYLQDTFQVFDRTTLIGGLRYDHCEGIGSTFNPRLALIQNLRPDTTVKLIYGEAFRAPSVYDLYYHDGGYTTKAAEDLDSETIKTWEAVLEHEFTPHWLGSASGFYYEMENLIAKYIDPADGLQVFRNLDTVRARGLELALNGRWDNGWRSRTSYAYVDTEDKATGRTLANSPHHLAKLNVIAPVVEKTLFAGLEVQYNSESKTPAGNRTDDFVLTNLTLTYTHPSGNLELSAGLYNLFDMDYEYPAFDEHVQDGIEQDGRTFRIKLTYRF